MKKMAKIVVLLVVVMIGTALSSCAGQIVETKVTLKITAGSDQIFNGEVAVTGENPTVLQVVKEAAIVHGIKAVYDDKDESVIKFSFYNNTEIDGNMYLWEYKINTLPPKTGKAGTNTVASGDTIEYNFNVGKPLGNDKFSWTAYDSASELFTEEAGGAVNEAEETTAAVS